MAQNFGVSFVPDEQNLQQGKAGVGRGAMTPTQQAIKLLSLRLPRVVGGSPIAPAPLLQSQGSKGMPSPDSIASQVLKNVLPTDQTQRDGMAAPSVPRQQTYQPDTPPSPSSYSMPSLRPGELDGGMNAPPGAYTTSPPTPSIGIGLNDAPALPPNIPTTPNSMPRETGRDTINPDAAGMPTQPPVSGSDTRGNAVLTPTAEGSNIVNPLALPFGANDVVANQIPQGAPLPPPDTTPSYVPSQPPMSADMQDLLNRMREKYGSPSYGYSDVLDYTRD